MLVSALFFVSALLQGIIKALRESSEALKAAKVNIFVRRGGPNYQEGLDMMRALGSEIGLPIEVGLPQKACDLLVSCVSCHPATTLQAFIDLANCTAPSE